MVVIAGADIPEIFLIPVAVGFIALVGLVAYLLFTRGGQSSGTPIEQHLALVLPVDKNENIGVGKLLTGVEQSETKIIVKDPDRTNNQGEPGMEFSVDTQGIMPAKFIDLSKNIVTMWGIFDRGEWSAWSFSDLLKTIKKRWDPLEAEPRDVGDFYVGWGFMRKMNQFLQSTSGKIMFGVGVGLIGYLLGAMTVILHVGHP